MSKTKKNNLIENSVLDRRYFIKTSTAALAAVTAGTIVSTSVDSVPSKLTTEDQNRSSDSTAKHWRAGWIAM